LKRAYKYFKKELLSDNNVWNTLSILVSLIIFSPILLIILNITGESNNWLHIKENLLFNYVFSTLYLVIGVGIISTVIGVGCAWFVTYYNFSGRKYIEWLLILPMTIPTYIAAYSYYDILEIFNPFFNWCRDNIGLEETIMIENILIYFIVIMLFSFVLYPYVYLSSKASLTIQGSRAIEAANTLGIPTNQLLWKVIIPIIRPGIIAGLSLVVMETLNDYAAVEYFGVSTLTIGIFRSWFGMYDMNSAIRLAFFLITFVFIVLVFEKVLRKGAKYDGKGSSSTLGRIEIRSYKQLPVILFCLTPLLLGFFIPVGRLLSWMLSHNVNMNDFNLLPVILNTLGISLASSVLIVLIAFFIIFSKNYFNKDSLRKLSHLAILGYSMPGAIIAIGILKLNSTINGFISFMLIGSISGLIFSYVVRFLAVSWQPIDSSMEKLGSNINKASRTLSVSPQKSLIHLNYPILKKSLLIACLIVFIDISKELPLTLILRPFNFDTLSTLTYDLISQAQFFQSSVPSLMIICISLPAIVLINRQVDKGV